MVHRDLKPANIKVSAAGKVKILDFGLAKAMAQAGMCDADPAESPTLTAHQFDRTRQGQILGTVAYMSPEQARGREVDGRADIWAFGVCLFEVLAGRRPFDGDDTATILGRLLEREPDWKELPADTPEPVRRLLFRCLTKDPEKRQHSVAALDLYLRIFEIRQVDPEVLLVRLKAHIANGLGDRLGKLSYVEQGVARLLSAADIAVMDNPASHRVTGMRQAISSTTSGEFLSLLL